MIDYNIKIIGKMSYYYTYCSGYNCFEYGKCHLTKYSYYYGYDKIEATYYNCGNYFYSSETYSTYGWSADSDCPQSWMCE